MSDKSVLFTTNDNTITNYTVSVSEEEYRYYQLMVEDVWGLQSTSDIGIGDSVVSNLIIYRHVHPVLRRC